MFPFKMMVMVSVLAMPLAFAQTPQVKVNVLNVCSPGPEEQKELTAALAKVPGKPAFGSDFEIARGRTTLDPKAPGSENLPATAAGPADWVRVRHEFPSGTWFSNAQYSFSVDSINMVETLVLRVREPKDVLQISIEDSASSVAAPAAMLAANTPAARIKVERFGKSSVVLARCQAGGDSPAHDQSVYEPLFRTASSILEHYRDALGVRRIVPQELTRMSNRAPVKAVSRKKQ